MDGSKGESSESSAINYNFEDYYLNTRSRKLFYSGRFIDITPKSFDVLQMLVENHGRTLTKDEMLEQVWEGDFVEEGNLAVHVSKLRRLLDADNRDEYIKTISGTGYRFVASVSEIEDDEWDQRTRNASFLEEGLSRKDKKTESIAILPLINENGEEGIDYLADGVTEALINSLSLRPNLRVLARNTVFRFKNRGISVRKIGKMLHVTSVLTGRFRIVDNQITIGVELMNVEDGRHLWGTQLNRPFEDIFEMQDSITSAIAEKLHAEIDRAENEELNQEYTKNTESYRLYLKGKHFVNNRRSIGELKKCRALFHESISLDPGFAAGYVELANCYRILVLYQAVEREVAYPRIESALSKAEALDNTLPRLYLIKASIRLYLDFDVAAARKNYLKALTLNPNSSRAHLHYARLLIYTGQLHEGLKQASMGCQLDPYSFSGNKQMAKVFLMTEQFELAILKLRECLDLEPSDFESLVFLGMAHCELGNSRKALRYLESALAAQHHLETIAMKGYTFAKSGQIGDANKMISVLKKEAESRYVPATYIAIIYSALEDTDNAFEYLELALEEKYIDLIGLKVDPRWNTLRSDTRFARLVDRIGLS